MRLVNFLVPVVILLSLTGVALAGELHPALEQAMAAKPDTEPVTALVVMREAVDVQALDVSLHEQKVTLAERHVTVIQTLQDAAQTSQRDIIEFLDSRVGQGVVSYTPHWIINGLMVTASKATIREIGARDDVDIVEPDIQPMLIEPKDRYQSAITGIGITPGVVNIGARRVWDELGIRGEGALIAGLDTGVDGNHPALSNRWRGLEAPWQECWLDVLGGNTQFPTDGGGHGTHCMGTMTGVALDDTIGVAPAAQWIATNPINQGVGGGFDNDILTCYEWIADPDGDPTTLDDVPDVCQNSWGVHEGFGYPDCDSRWWTAIDGVEAAGCVVVFAAGNEGPGAQTLRSPADRCTTIYNCFAVGATSHSYPYQIAGFSSRGPAGPNCGPEENRVKPEISAPGVSIYSAAPGGGYWYMDGTSMACPHVSGVVALMRSANPGVDVITIKQVIMDTAMDLGPDGEDNTYGHGFIDAYQAVLAVMAGFGTVEGTVTDAATGDPIEGAQITVEGQFQETETAADGSFSFMVPAGTHVFHISAFGYEDISQEVQVDEDVVNPFDPEMTALPQVVVSGTVYLPDGSPAPGAILVVEDTPVANMLSGAQGEYSVSLPGGTDYTLQVSAGVEGFLELTVPFVDDLELDLFLQGVHGEGFEAGDMSGLTWYFTGGAEWYAQQDEVNSGAWASQSGAVPNTNFSQMQCFIDCGDGGQMSFWFKVSSEASADYLRFYVGNDEVDAWSGEQGWTRAAYDVPGGVVSFRWRYQKDSSGTAGQDCAWVDDIVFPGGAPEEARIVVAPATVAADMAVPGLATVPAYVFNQGAAELTWSLSESADWLDVTPLNGTVPAGVYQALDFEFDGTGLPDGIHTTQVSFLSNDPISPSMYVNAELTVGGTVAIGDVTPQAFALIGAVPNPFNPMTTVHFSLPATQHAVLGIYDVRGQLVRTLVDAVRPAGLNEVQWDGRDHGGQGVASGTYFARLRASGQTSVKTLTLVR